MTDAPSLEERVAALEEMIAHPLQIVSAPPGNFSDAQVAELREALGAAMSGPYEHRILPPVPSLTPDQVRQLLRECVTVVKPGETLIVRVPLTGVPEQVDRYARDLGEVSEAMDLPFKTVVVAAEELGVAEPGGVPGAS